MCDEVVPVIANDKESKEAMTAAELTEKPGLLNLRHRSNSSKLILNTSMSANHTPSRDRCESREVEQRGTRNKRQHENSATDEQEEDMSKRRKPQRSRNRFKRRRIHQKHSNIEQPHRIEGGG